VTTWRAIPQQLAKENSKFIFSQAVAENYVLTQVVATTKSTPYFWRSDNTAEVDFVIQVGGEIVPIDVKAETNTSSRSLSVYKSKYDPTHTLKISMKPTLNGHLPLYAAWALPDYMTKQQEVPAWD